MNGLSALRGITVDIDFQRRQTRFSLRLKRSELGLIVLAVVTMFTGWPVAYIWAMPKGDLPAPPDVEAAWSVIRAACLRRTDAKSKRVAVGAAVNRFLDGLHGLPQGEAKRLRSHMSEIIRIELRAQPKPSVKIGLTHARDLIAHP